MNPTNLDDDKGRFTDHYYLNILPTYDTTSKLEPGFQIDDFSSTFDRLSVAPN